MTVGSRPTGPDAVRRILERVTARVGLTTERARRTSVERTVGALLSRDLTIDDIAERISAGDADTIDAVCSSVCVAETYFFRQPEHFEFLAREFLPGRTNGDRPLRAWSAGCASGEEAYSLAACLSASLPGLGSSVLGTDLLMRNVRAAEGARYGERWSIRARLMFPLLEPDPGPNGERQVLRAVRAAARFRQHNLLDPLPAEEGPFDIIFCRNVLGYFRPEAAREACKNLCAALAPGGVIVFAPVDPVHLPPGHRQIGRPELHVFTQSAKERSIVPAPARVTISERDRSKTARSAAPAPRRSLRPHGAHPAASGGGDRKPTDDRPRSPHRHTVDGVPTLFEEALTLARAGRRLLAADAMREVLRRTDGLPPDLVLHGGAELPVSYFRAGATAFLAGASTTDRRRGHGHD